MTAGLFLLIFGAAPADADAEYRAGLDRIDDSAAARPHFRRAAEAYDEAWRSGRTSPDVALNGSAAWFLAGEPGRAVLSVRRALRLHPSDAELRSRLAELRTAVAAEAVGDPRTGVATPLLDRVTPQTVEVIARTGYAVGCLAAAFGLATRRRTWLIAGMLLLVAAVGVSGWMTREERRLADAANEPAAVVTTAAVLRSGNGEAFPAKLDRPLSAGTEVRLIGERGGWLHVETADGVAGWLPPRSAVPVG